MIRRCIAGSTFRESLDMVSIFRGAFRAGLLALSLFATDVRAQNDAASRRAAIDGMYPFMLGALEAKSFGQARRICEQAILWEPQNPTHHYNLACIEAQAGGTRLPYAWGALELAIALGFNDARHLQNDPDLAPLRHEPRFAELVRNIIFTASTGQAADSPRVRANRANNQAAIPTFEASEQPPPAGFKDDIPVGLYLMSRYVSTTQENETSVWYFAPNGEVYRELECGFSASDLSSHTGPRGSVSRRAKILEITWSNGEVTTSILERDGTGFTWDMGIFVPVKPFESDSEVAGLYEGSAAVTPGRDEIPVAQRLDLRPDRTFIWQGVAFKQLKYGAENISIGSTEVTEGNWSLSGFSLILMHGKETTVRRIAIPLDDEKTVIRPDRMFFGDLTYKRRP
jgi:hypothetical protein